ncbi:MAG TPA: alpha-rhamnosidase, partial [Prolixibacteraceae bacterium]|nr:alpha-rhamnosidase [Prolixibacteraceae bacterium]
GATTTWEHWNGARSHIHNCYNGIGSWFYQAVGGIRPVENVAACARIRISPQIPEGVTWANTTRDTPYGKVVVNWKLTNGKMELDIEIPVGVEAEVAIPAGTTEYFINQVRTLPDGATPGSIPVKSGTYRIQYAVG